MSVGTFDRDFQQLKGQGQDTILKSYTVKKTTTVNST